MEMISVSNWRESTQYHKKLIEVALPLEAINAASAHEKSIRHGHPSNLHLWWARRPLAACRAVLFASIVDDPSSRPEEFPTEEDQEAERQRLFKIIDRMVLWENSDSQPILDEARGEILKATEGHPPSVLDPFCGAGSIPLEAQRLGLEVHVSDLNPVAVLITKSLIEIPSKFVGRPPVNPEARRERQKKIQGQDFPNASGLAEDVLYYGKCLRDEAEKQIGHLYPKAKLSDGSEATVIAWLWARNVKCPNPACGAMMPLVKSFLLSKKKGRKTWIEPVVKRGSNGVEIKFDLKSGLGEPLEGTVNRRGARCLACGTAVSFEYIRAEGRAKRIGAKLMAIAAEGNRRRIYLSANDDHENLASKAEPNWIPDFELPANPRNFNTPNYGLSSFRDIFTNRQLIALDTFADLMSHIRRTIHKDSIEAGMIDDNLPLCEGGENALAYTDAVLTYLAFVIDKQADLNNSLCAWKIDTECPVHLFARQAIPMCWDFAEANPLSRSAGSWQSALNNLILSMSGSCMPAIGHNHSVQQLDARIILPSHNENSPIISTDPPYYDNISYADLSDFFYIWMRRSLFDVFPELFSTILTPKSQELIANPYRFGGDQVKARNFFEDGLAKAFSLIKMDQNTAYPLTFYYAFKQSEYDKDKKIGNNFDNSSTGWETMLEGLMKAGFGITGTWPMRTEMEARQVAMGSNALASSIVLVCRSRPDDAPIGTRKELIIAMKRELPEALRQLQMGNIAPVDLAQAAIGPGMAIFSRYSKVLEADGSPMRVRTALQLINQHLDEYLSEQESEYDPDTRWALSWFEQYGMTEGPYGDAETLSKAKNTSVEGMVEAGILRAGAGKARLLRRDEMDPSWDPVTDHRLTVWEAMQHLIHTLDKEGEAGASELQQKLGGLAQSARDLAYRLYSICERKAWSHEALAYNSLVIAWPRLQDLAAEKMRKGGQQTFEV